MTSQVLISKPLDQMTLSQSRSTKAEGAASRVFQSVRSLYSSDQQAEYLNLSAQVESLLVELQTLQASQ